MSGAVWPDLLVLVIVVLAAYGATRRGFVAVLMSLGGFVVSLLIAFAFYPVLAGFLTGRLGWSPVWSVPAAFVILWVGVEAVFGLVEGMLVRRTGYTLRYSPTNRLLAVIPGALQGLIFSAVLLTALALLPLQSGIRSAIFQAPVSSKLVNATLAVERPFENIFGAAAREAMGFITVKPPAPTGASEAPEQGVKLNFTVDNATVDTQGEEGMLAMVNQERVSRGIAPLEMDAPLRLLARARADDMFRRGYFSHNTPEGQTPFDQMRSSNIPFLTAGENIALAPTLELAHQGFMNSSGHRANILNPDYRKIGIGVLDGGVYGEMFVQEFTD